MFNQGLPAIGHMHATAWPVNASMKVTPSAANMPNWLDVAKVWGLLAAVTLVLMLVGWHFTRRTMRAVTVVIVFLAAVAVTYWGADAKMGFSGAFHAGLHKAAAAFFAPFFLGRTTPSADDATWTIFLIICAAGYWLLEAWSARFESPTVQVEDVDKDTAEPGLVRELQYRLPAVQVSRPALVPGGTTAENLAAVVEKADIKGAGFYAALLNLARKIWPQPRGFTVRVLCEEPESTPPRHGAGTTSSGAQLRVTVDVRDARTGQSRMVKTLACNSENRAERVAAFAARTVFRDDPAVPRWSVGSFDGEDLAAYLMFQQVCAAANTPEETRKTQDKQAEQLTRAVRNSPGAGIARYELAQLEDMRGDDPTKALRLHAINCVQYPRFYRAQYALAMSLITVAGEDDVYHYLLNKVGSDDRDELVHNLRKCGLAEQNRREDHSYDLTLPDQNVLLELAEKKCVAYRHALRFHNIIWHCLYHRDERSGWRPYLLPVYLAHHHRRQVREGIRMTERLIQFRKHMAEQPRDAEKIRKVIAPVLPPVSDGQHPRQQRWHRSWSAKYNAARINAAVHPYVTAGPCAGKLADAAVALLESAINDPDCEIERPFDWIAKDPSFFSLRDEEIFLKFLRNQLDRDYPAMKHKDYLAWAWDRHALLLKATSS